MSKKKSRVVGIAEVRELLHALDEEKIDQIQKRTLDYTLKMPRADPDKVKSAVSKIVETAQLSEEEAYEVLNIHPKSVPEMRVFTSGWKKLIPSETLEKILDYVDEAYK